MCRIFLSINSHCEIKNKIYNFLKQSIHKKKFTPLLDNYRDYDYNQNGFGLAWLNYNIFKIYKNTCLFNEDKILNEIINKIPKKIIIGHIRKRSISTKSYNNTHPFIYKNNIFVHNGRIQDFENNAKILVKYMNCEYVNCIKGETDSELLFYLFLSFLGTSKKYKESINKLYKLFKDLDIELSANIIFANLDVIIVTRFLYYNQKKYLSRETPPSLYIDRTDGIIISSEPITNNWELIKENSIILFDIKNLI